MVARWNSTNWNRFRVQIESGFDEIDAVAPEIRGMVARNWATSSGKAPA